MACPHYDFHIHTKYLGCANATMEIPAIIKECERHGVTTLGITDHNTIGKLQLHRHIRKDLDVLETSIPVYFGVELNFLEQDGSMDFTPEIKEEFGFQFAIGGIHSTYLDTYDLKRIIDIQHRHHLRVCRDPLVDVLVHPYWFSPHEFKEKKWPWFDSMSAVPESYARELGQTAKETGTAIELNAGGNLAAPEFSDRYVNEYMDFLAIVAAEGCLFSVGSDAHDINSLQSIRTSWRVAEKLNLSPDRIWKPKGKPFTGGK